MTATNMGTGYGIGCYAPSPVGEVRVLLAVSVVRGLQDDALQVETPAVIKPSGAAGGLRGCDGDKP